ncbi:MAG: hypothetical protein V1817_00400 [Candidatus Micrarchaeota archaeon]
MYEVGFEDEAKKQFFDLDKTIQYRIEKKVGQLERDDFKSRHLKHGVPVFVEEIGQYRLVFKTIEAKKEKRILFVGDHKHYKEWYSSFFKK